MPDTPEILRLRVLLCFLRENEKDCTVMEIARTLGEEHYTVSRAIAALEKEGLISRKQPRRPQLTEAGRMQAQRYAERISTTMNHLLYEGVNVESAKNDAFYWRCITQTTPWRSYAVRRKSAASSTNCGIKSSSAAPCFAKN